MSSERAIFRGIMVPLITPLDAGCGVDVSGLKRVLGHVIRGGVDSVLLLGSTGENVSLAKEVKKEVVRRGVEVCSGLRGGVPVIVGVMDCSEEDSLEMVEWASECGADAVLCAGPFYYKVRESVLGKSLERLADQSELPMMVYHYPGLTGNKLNEEVVSELFDHPNVIGMKDSSGDMTFLEKVIRVKDEREDVVILVGPDVLLYPALVAGADGGVPGGANILPRVYADLFAAVNRENHDKAKLLHKQLVEMTAQLYGEGEIGINEAVKSLKCALGMMGMCDVRAAMPLELLEWNGRARLRRLLMEQGLVM
ncbi:dihydrodipicolinate synthase family protein [Planctomycetota bacterium]|nr:dihydrodipicolinate synthase family protein [Planctomycetota bacterium]